MDYHGKPLLYYDEGRIKPYNYDQNKNIVLVNPEKIIFVTPEETFVYHAQVITTSKDQGSKLGPDKSSISTDHDSNIIGRHWNALLSDEWSDKVYMPDLDTVSKRIIDIAQCAKYLSNDSLNQNIDTPGSNFSYKYYVTPTNLPKDRK